MRTKIPDPAKENAEKLIALLPQLLRGLLKREDNFLTQGKISFPQMLALECLSRAGVCRMSELAQTLSIQMASATGLADRLIKAGYIRRKPDARDRRVVRIALTPKGKNVVENIFQQKKRIMMNVFQRISPVDSRQYLNVLEKIVKILSEDPKVRERGAGGR